MSEEQGGAIEHKELVGREDDKPELVTCPHPTLTTTANLTLDGMQYQCKMCKKKIQIPETTMIRWGKDAQNNLAGIIGLNFGEYWAERTRRGEA